MSCPATPKSASLAWPSEFSRMFPALMSLWIFLVKCRYSRPFRMDCRMVPISSSVSCSTQMQQISNNTADGHTCAHMETVYRLIANLDDVGHRSGAAVFHHDQQVAVLEVAAVVPNYMRTEEVEVRAGHTADPQKGKSTTATPVSPTRPHLSHCCMMEISLIISWRSDSTGTCLIATISPVSLE